MSSIGWQRAKAKQAARKEARKKGLSSSQRVQAVRKAGNQVAKDSRKKTASVAHREGGNEKRTIRNIRKEASKIGDRRTVVDTQRLTSNLRTNKPVQTIIDRINTREFRKPGGISTNPDMSHITTIPKPQGILDRVKGMIGGVTKSLQGTLSGPRVSVEDVAKEVPGTIARGVRKAGEIGKSLIQAPITAGYRGAQVLGERAAYDIYPQVKEQYEKGNLDILPNVSKYEPAQMFGAAAETALMGLPMGKATKAVRALRGLGTGAGYGITGALQQNRMPTASDIGVGAVIGGALDVALGPELTRVNKDLEQLKGLIENPHAKKIVDKYKYKANEAVQIHGKPQMVPIPESLKKEIAKVKQKFIPESETFKFIQEPKVGLTIKDVSGGKKSPLIEEGVKKTRPIKASSRQESGIPTILSKNKEGGSISSKIAEKGKKIAVFPELSSESLSNKTASYAKNEIINTKSPEVLGKTELPATVRGLPKGKGKSASSAEISGVQNMTSEGKILQKTQQTKPSIQVDKISDFYNVDRMKISDKAKEAVNNEIKLAGDRLEKTVGKTLTHKETIDQANMVSKTLNKIVDRDTTKEAIAANLNLRRKIAQAAENGKIDRDFVDLWLKDKAMGENIARQLEARKIVAKPEEADHINVILDAIYKVNKDADGILKEAEKVDFNDPKQVIDFYRKFVKPKAGDWLDKLRYNSMLSSPNTHLINTASNLEGTGIIAPIEKTITGMLDATRSALTGSERKYYTKEGVEYAKGYYSNIAEGARRFKAVMRGELLSGNPDVRNLPLTTGGAKRVVEKVLDYPMRLLEGMDQFFTAMTSGGVERALKYRASKGVGVGNIKSEAFVEAQKRLFRASKDETQGAVLEAIDGVTNLIMRARNHENPILRTISKFTLPFVRTPMNLLKQGIEYSPLGISTLAGAKNKTEQLSKVIIGTASALGAATLLGQDRLTWAEPTDEKGKAAFRAAGRQPYSVKIGDNWVSYSKLHPAIAFNLALVSSVDDALKTKKIDDSTADSILTALAKYGNFLADQSYAKNIGDFLAATKGDAERWTAYFSNYPQQLIPGRALMGWITRIVDPEQRKIDKDGTLLQKQMQQIMSTIPGLSKYVPARLDEDGNPILNQNRAINAISPNRITTEVPEKEQKYQELIQKRQEARVHQELLDKAKLEVKKTGQAQTVGDTTVYMEDGEVKTTQGKYTVDAKQKYKEYKGLSDNEFKMKMIELKDQGEAQSTIADELMKYRRNDIAKEIGLEYEKDWSDLNNQDKSNIVMKKLNSLHEMDRGKLFQQMVDRDFITDPLKKEVGVQLYEKMKGTVEEKVDGLNMYEDGSEIRKTIVKAMFNDINAMKAAGSNDEAQAVVDRMSDSDYETYKDARQAWRAGNTKKLDELMKVNTDEGVEFLRSLYKEEQDRILDSMTDEEWEAYKKAKEEYGTKTISELQQKANEFYGSINKDLYNRDAEYKAVVDKQIALNTEAEQKLAGTMKQNVMALSNEAPTATLASSINIGEGTLAQRNNNPGNLRFAGQEGASQGEGGFARFESPEAGYEALKAQIELDASRGITVSEFVSKYAPPTENDTATYIKQFNASVGSDSGTKLSSLDTEKVAEFMALKESSTRLGERIASNPPTLNQSQTSLLRSVASGKTSEDQATKKVLDEFNKVNSDSKAQEAAAQIAIIPPKVPYSNIGYIPPEFFNPTSRIYGLIASLQLLQSRWSGTAPNQII